MMIQFFFKATAIKQNEWESSYKKIEALVKAFPLNFLYLSFR
jgi:hypothetical protein